jgi:hypothetical protein
VEQWKRDLVTILAEDAARHPGQEAFVLWDFSGYNSITTEEVPPGGDTDTEMRWYWEASHYKKEVGDMMLEKIFGSNDPAHEIPDDFGIRLTVENIDEQLRLTKERQLTWHHQHEQDLQELRELVKVAQSQRTAKRVKKA